MPGCPLHRLTEGSIRPDALHNLGWCTKFMKQSLDQPLGVRPKSLKLFAGRAPLGQRHRVPEADREVG